MRLLQESNTRSLYDSIKESLDYDVNEPNSMDTVRYHRDNNIGGSILINTYSDNFPSDPLTKEDVGKRVYDLRAYPNGQVGFEAYDVVEDDQYDGGIGYMGNKDEDIWDDNFNFDMTDDEVDSYAKKTLGFNKPKKESVMINTGSTTITSDETGVTVEDNGNTITSGNGVTVDVDNEADVLPAEMDITSPVDEVPTDIVADVPAEDIENVEPVEELPSEDEENEEGIENVESVEELPSEDEENEEDLDESTVNEEVLEKKDEETEEEVNNSKIEESTVEVDVYTDASDEQGIIDEIRAGGLPQSVEVKVIEVNGPAGGNPLVHLIGNMSDIKSYLDKQGFDEDSYKVLKEADGYNQNQNVEIYQNPEFDYQILDITELDNVDSGDIRAVDMANILNDLDESLTEAYGDPNYFSLNSFLTRKGTHKKTNESYSSAILELGLPKLNESIGEYKNTFFLEVYGDKALKECVVRDSSNHIIKEYSGKSTNPVEHFKNVMIDIDRTRRLTEEIFRQEAYLVAESVANQFYGQELINWEDFRDAFEMYTNEVNPSLLSDENLHDFEMEVRDVLSWNYGYATIYEGEYEGGLTNNSDMFEAVEIMVNEPMKDKGVNFADSKAITKDEERQKNHLKQHANRNKENKKFKIEKEPDQENTTGVKEEDITDTEKVDKLPKAKKTKVDAEKLKVKEIKESESLTEATDEEAEKMLSIQRWMENNDFEDRWEEGAGWAEPTFELMKKQNYNSFVAEKRDWVAYKDRSALGEFDEMVKRLNESESLKEADELLDEPEVTDGSDMRDGREDLEESGSDVAIFHRKPQSVSAMRAAEQNGITVNKSNYKIVGKKELSGEEFEKFANDLSSESYDWLKEYNDTSTSGEFKCVEVINTDDDSYSLLVDPQGYNYARYAAIKDNLGNEEELIEPEEELISEE